MDGEEKLKLPKHRQTGRLPTKFERCAYASLCVQKSFSLAVLSIGAKKEKKRSVL